MKIAR